MEKASRRLFLAAGPVASLFGALGIAVAARALPLTASDPVYAAIAEHKKANAAFTAICAKYEDFGQDDMTDEQNDEYDAAMEADDAALDDVARTVPTTRDGAWEALRYVFTQPVRIEAISNFIITLLNVAYPEAKV